MSWLVAPSLPPSLLVLQRSAALLKLLATLKGQVPAIQNRSPVELLDLLLADRAQYGNLIGDVAAGVAGGTVDELIADWRKIRDIYSSQEIQRFVMLSRSFDLLAAMPDKLPRSIDWKALERDYEVAKVPNDVITLKAGLAGSLAFSFDALPDPATILPAGFQTLPVGDRLLHMGFKGALRAQASVGARTGFLGVTLSGEAKGEVQADVYFAENGDTPVGVAVADNLRILCAAGLDSPFSVSGLSRLIKNEALRCLKLRGEGQLVFGAEIKMGHSFTADKAVKVELGAAIESRLTRTGIFEYTLAAHQVEGEPAIAILIRRSRAEQQVLSESLGLVLDARPLAKELNALLLPRLGQAEASLKHFDSLLPGADFISKRLGEVIDAQFKQAPDLEAVIRSLVGITPDAKAGDVLRDLLVGKIETALDGWSEDATQATARILLDVRAALPPELVTQTTLIDLLEKSIQAALAEKQAQLKQAVEAKLKSPDAGLLVAQLNGLSQSISGAIGQVQQEINAVTDAVRRLLQRAQRRIAEMRGFLETAATKTISLSLAAQIERESKEGLELRFDLFPGRAGAQEMLDDLLHGDMRLVMQRIASQGKKPAAEARAGAYSVYLKRKESRRSDLVLWDFKLSGASLLDTEVSWTVGLDGSITAKSQSSHDKIDSGRGERNTVHFIERCDFFFAQEKRSLSLGLTLSNEDESLSLGEVQAFFDGVRARGLLPQYAVDRAMAEFRKQGAANTRKGRLDIGLTLDGEQMARMLAAVTPMRTDKIHDDEDGRLPKVQCAGGQPLAGCTWVLNTVSAVEAAVYEKHHSDPTFIKNLKYIIEKRDLGKNLAGAIRSMTLAAWNAEYGAYNPESSGLAYSTLEYLPFIDFLQYRRYGAMALYEILAHLRALADTPMGKDAHGADAWTAEQLEAQQYRIAQLVAVWWHWLGEWKNSFFLTDQMRASTLAFLESWMALARGPDGEGPMPVLWASISLANEDGKLVPVLLT